MSIDSSDAEVLARSIEWLEAGFTVDMVTVARTWGSSPRPPGSLAAIRDDGVIIGSVSGGCVEKQLSEDVRASAGPRDRARVLTHRIDDQQARRYGLACGGNLELVFEALEDVASLKALQSALLARQRQRRIVTLATGRAITEPASRNDTFEFDGQVLQKVFGPGWRVLLIGAGQLSRYTAEFALALDFEVMVCEPRAPFRQSWSVPGTTLLADMPDDAVSAHATDPQSAVLALTHDASLDDLALQEALPSQAFYVGALGSRKNHAKRRERLAFLGISPESAERLHGPVGLSIGSRTSAEIAIAIMAELIQTRSQIGPGLNQRA